MHRMPRRSDTGDSAAATVGYSTAVRVALPGLPKSVKRAIWRDRQIQHQAFNWGVEDALRLHFRGKHVPSPRNNSAPLTAQRRNAGSTHSVLLQRGGYWSAVDAAKKWSKRRRTLQHAQSKSAKATGKTLAALAKTADKKNAAAVAAQAAAMTAALALYRKHRQHRVELADSGEKAALHLRPRRPAAALTELSPDERSAKIAETADAADKTLESFNTALTALRAAIGAADVTDAARKRLRELADKARTAAAAEARADKKLLAHIAKGETRLFRRRRDTERGSGAALVLFEGCTIKDGKLRLPGRTEIPLPAGCDTVEAVVASGRGEDLEWNGALHIVDVTDLAGRVTRRTGPEHRKYHVHFLCRAKAAAPREPDSPEQSLGTDWGVEVPLVRSDGTAYGRYATPEQQAANQRRHAEAVRLQQSMANKTEGSRRYAKQQRRRQRNLDKNTNVRINRQRHTAKHVVTADGVRRVVLEDTKIANMVASAVGTKAFPVRGSAGKRGLNRSICETAPARQASFIERAGVIHSVSVARVAPAYSSLTCFKCGALGERETQALFWCPECRSYTHADVQASLNTGEAGNPGLYPSARDVTYGGRDSRHKMLDAAVGVFLAQTGINGGVTNEYAAATRNGHSGI